MTTYDSLVAFSLHHPSKKLLHNRKQSTESQLETAGLHLTLIHQYYYL